MPRAFATIAFTDTVKAAQRRYGSRESNRGFELARDKHNELTEGDAQFIAARDSFYQATVSETGWPYVQHRGGPAGFLQVLDCRTIGYADFSGNRQYLSVGNLSADSRIALILMDYPNQSRLKIWGRARIVHEADEPELIARLELPGYEARVERGIVIDVEAVEWNCPQHITPRYTEEEFGEIIAPLLEENSRLRDQDRQMPVIPPILGEGPLALVISGVRQLAPRVRAYELRHPEGEMIPAIEAGAYLSVPVLLHDGSASVRHYSISSNPARRDAYEIAVLLQADGAGGSQFIHDRYELGQILHCAVPHNNFSLHADERPAVLIAGGIGITPIKAMALALKAQDRRFFVHYAGRSRRDMAYLDRLQRQFGDQLRVYATDQQPMELARIMSAAPAESMFYVCGPQRLVDGVLRMADELGISTDRIRIERFSASSDNAQSIEVELKRSGKTVLVSPTESILSAVEAAGILVPAECRVGQCGSCAVKVLEGSPQHCDVALSDHEHVEEQLMCICVSRASSSKLVLDL